MTGLTVPRRIWIVTLAALVVIGSTASLGLWQLSRAAEKQQLIDQRTQRQSLPMVGWADVATALSQGDADGLIDRPVQLDGYWRHEATVYLENRPMKGRPGFVVVTPLVHPSGQPAVAVQRGWVPRRLDDRTAVPDLSAPPVTVRVTGRLAPPPSKLYELGDAGTGRIRQNIDLSQYSQEWALPMWPVSLQQSAGDPPDALLERDWPIVGVDVHKHYGYAVQWFGLSLLTLMLYVWFQFIAPRRQRQRRVVRTDSTEG